MNWWRAFILEVTLNSGVARSFSYERAGRAQFLCCPLQKIGRVGGWSFWAQDRLHPGQDGWFRACFHTVFRKGWRASVRLPANSLGVRFSVAYRGRTESTREIFRAGCRQMNGRAT